MISQSTLNIIRRIYYFVVILIFFKFCTLVCTDKKQSVDKNNPKVETKVSEKPNTFYDHQNETKKSYEEEVLIDDIINKNQYETEEITEETTTDEYYQTNEESTDNNQENNYREEKYKSPTTNQPNYYIHNVRIGAWCNDGTYSNATGSGACSHHGGVAEWVYE